MNGVKFEENVDLQGRAARLIAAFASFQAVFNGGAGSNPTEKVVKNLCTVICQDVSHPCSLNIAARETVSSW